MQLKNIKIAHYKGTGCACERIDHSPKKEDQFAEDENWRLLIEWFIVEIIFMGLNMIVSIWEFFR